MDYWDVPYSSSANIVDQLDVFYTRLIPFRAFQTVKVKAMEKRSVKDLLKDSAKAMSLDLENLLATVFQ
jgi:hypothetical protein